MRHWLWRLLSKPEYFRPVPAHEFTPWLHHDAPCIYCGKADELLREANGSMACAVGRHRWVRESSLVCAPLAHDPWLCAQCFKYRRDTEGREG